MNENINTGGNWSCSFQLLSHGRWFSPGTPASSITKTGRHDKAEILLKVELNTKIQIQIQIRSKGFIILGYKLFDISFQLTLSLSDIPPPILIKIRPIKRNVFKFKIAKTGLFIL